MGQPPRRQFGIVVGGDVTAEFSHSRPVQLCAAERFTHERRSFKDTCHSQELPNLLPRQVKLGRSIALDRRVPEDDIAATLL
jgi:hypothetical protein